MNPYRCGAVALATCAAALSLAACSAGVTTAAPPAAPSRGTSAASPGATTSGRPSSSPTVSRPAPSGTMVQVSAAIGSFPVPAGAKVAENITSSLQTIVIFGGISPANVSAFYAQALPRAGYTISGNSIITESGNVVVAIQFAGHGIKGNIGSLAKFNGSSVGLGGLGDKNVSTVSFQSK
jgi:ABC-type phosphate transport system substrate-binding protein